MVPCKPAALDAAQVHRRCSAGRNGLLQWLPKCNTTHARQHHAYGNDAHSISLLGQHMSPPKLTPALGVQHPLPASTLKNDSMSASVPKSPSPLKSDPP